MNDSQILPAWVIGQVLNASRFACCGNEDLAPFRCVNCGHAMVLCCECDTLYVDLPDVSKMMVSNWNECKCLHCKATFSCDIFDDPECRISFSDWSACQLDEFLSIPPITELFDRLQRSSLVLADCLERNMQSTAKMRSRDMRRLADAIEHCYPGANEARQTALTDTLASSHKSVLLNSLSIADPIQRAYAVLGISESLSLK